MGFSPIFDIVFALNIALPIIGIASMIMVTISLIQSSKAQRSIARTLERIEQGLKQNKP